MFSITLTRAEYISAFWLYLRRRWLWKPLALTFMAIVALYFALMVGLEAWDWGFDAARLLPNLQSALFFSAIVSVAIFLISQISVRFRLGRLFDELGIAGRATQFEFDNTGLRSANSEATTSYAWSRFKYRCENDRFILLMLADSAFIVIPKAQVGAEQLAEFKQTLSSACMPLR